MALKVAAVVSVLLATGGAAEGGSGGEIERLATRKKVVVLTFDGGDNMVGAPAIMRVLRRRRVPATFFITGRMVRRYPRLARAIGRRYPVGNHTWDHADLTHLSSRDVRREVTRCAWWIRAGTGRNPRPLFRFPYGARDARTLAIVRSLGYVSVRWSVDTLGWMGPSGGQSTWSVTHRVASQLEPGAIVLMHLGLARDGSLLDARALPAVIDVVRHRGYRFVALDAWLRKRR
jgi:peptidoglycan/xylan/chitin deacetylase (PgdA/CDA1 family)